MAKVNVQTALMRFSPVDGTPQPYPSNADDFRTYQPRLAWLYDPWTGEKRTAADIFSDVQGQSIVPAEV